MSSRTPSYALAVLSAGAAENGEIRLGFTGTQATYVLPYILPIALVAFCYWLLKSKKVSPVKVILIVAVLAFVLGAAGIVA